MESSSFSLLSTLQSSSDLRHIHRLFSAHLLPFQPLLNKSPNQKTDTRALAKQYLTFLNKSLSLIPSRLSESPSLSPSSVSALLAAYNLTLDCLQSVSAHLSGKPYLVHSQRVRLVRCYEGCGKYEEGEREGVRVLEGLRMFGGPNEDADLAGIVAEVVVMVVKCVYMKEGKGESDYRNVMGLVEEVAPWLRVLDASANNKFHRVLVAYLTKFTMLLVGKLKFSNKDLVHEFLLATFAECRRLSVNDQLHKYAARICSSLFLLQDGQSSVILDILSCVLDTIAIECKVDDESSIIEFLEIVSYCSNKCRRTTKHLCGDLARHIKKLAGDLHQVDLILRLYSTGLFLNDSRGQPRQNNTTTRNNNSESIIGFLLDKDDVLHDLSVLLGISKTKSLPTINAGNNSAHKMCSDMLIHKAPGFCKMKNGKQFLLPFYYAMKFVCQPLAEDINSARNEIFSQAESSFPTMLFIRDAFLQFCGVFLFCHSTLDQKSIAVDDYDRAMLGVAVAALLLSFKTNSYIKECVKVIKQVISADWIQANALKFLCLSIYNIGVTLFRSNQVKEAAMAMKLCCRAAWTCVSRLSKTFMDQLYKSSDDVSEDDDFVNEACAKSAFLLDLLSRCNDHNKAKKVIRSSLEEWSAAADVFKRLSSPLSLVKQWVKIECKLCKDPKTEDAAVSLYSLLSSSTSVLVKKNLGVILEQELSSYNEVRALNPKLCHNMQMDIIDVLLTRVYGTDNSLQRSKILITKGRELRASGFEGLDGCIQCFSEAISLLEPLRKNGVNDERVLQLNAICHHLAMAYALRALCNQEANPNSKSLSKEDDIIEAVNLWLKPECLADDQYENVLMILYHVIDMLSLKGCTKFHSGIYKLLIRLLTKKIPLAKCMSLLWQCRRLSDALCPSPLNEASVSTLSQLCGETFQSLNFWKNCLSGSLPLEIGFWQRFFFMITNISCGVSLLGGSYKTKIEVDNVKQAASDLTSTVPLSSDSAFLAAHLYYDLCERMISYGRLSEALTFAKEAHRLRCKLLQDNFRYLTNQQSKVQDETGETVQKHHYTFGYFQIHSSVATTAWPQEKKFFNFEAPVLTPWNVLQCYLQSTLQVGIVHELMGDGSEAESLLLWGKSISSFQGLRLFEIVFASVLGRVYRKKQLWDQAEKELSDAKRLFEDPCTAISCSKCRLLMEGTIFGELGEFFRSRKGSYTGSFNAKPEFWYKSAMGKLNDLEWKNPVSDPKKVRDDNEIVHDAPKKVQTQGDVPEAKRKKSRTTKSSAKSLVQGQCPTAMPNQRMTRSKYRLQTTKENAPWEEVPVGPTEQTNNEQHFVFSDTLEHRGETFETCGTSVDFGAGMSCFCNKKKCWYCLLVEVMQSGSIENVMLMQWEFTRRKLSLKLLSRLGNYLDACGENENSEEQLVQCISVLVSRNSFSVSSMHQTFLLDLIGKDLPEDPFAIERAALLYDICWFTLKSYPCKGSRVSCYGMDNIQISNIISWLMLAFVLCREVPVLFQKVSRLLAVVFVLSASTQLFPHSVSLCKTLSESHWASYFHQISIGTHVNHQVCSSMIGKGCCLTNPRLVPDTFQDLEAHISRFFHGFPCATIIGISLLGGSFASLLSNILKYRARAWILLSRLSSNCQPVVLLLPVDSILEETDADENPGSGILFEDKEVTKCWHSPWGSTVVDEVAPMFRLILEKSYLSSSVRPQEDTPEIRRLWWNQRKGLDQQLGKFMRDLEDLWLGQWNHLLLGDWSGCDNQELVYKKLMCDLKAKCDVDAPESLLKVILGGAKFDCSRKECVLQLLLNGGCLVGGMDHQVRRKALADTADGVETLSEGVYKLILEATRGAKEADLNREPVILILDYDIQMLPWESLPILRNQEVYRMPSIRSVFATLDRCCQCHNQVGMEPVAFPMIDPLDAFYVLNPSGDLITTQTEFEDWFRDQNLEGKVGISPTVDELVLALRSHDLYIYFGHGSGAQYIPGHEIQKLKNCAATFLMGCSSGSLSLDGSYAPKGAPLSYLLAGSPVIVANLWDVTDKDIDRFGKAMLNNWLRERSDASSDCTQCKDLVAEKLKSMQITGTKGNAKKKTSRKNTHTDSGLSTLNDCCNHRPKIGSFVGQARDACTLPFLIGAAPVCYGVPTRIMRKKV